LQISLTRAEASAEAGSIRKLIVRLATIATIVAFHFLGRHNAIQHDQQPTHNSPS
jgi:hypothetical protein